MTLVLQHEVFLASCYRAPNFVNVASMVNYMRQNYGTATEKLGFECGKSFSGATANLYQQNSCMKSEIISMTIPFCTVHYLLYQ